MEASQAPENIPGFDDDTREPEIVEHKEFLDYCLGLYQTFKCSKKKRQRRQAVKTLLILAVGMEQAFVRASNALVANTGPAPAAGEDAHSNGNWVNADVPAFTGPAPSHLYTEGIQGVNEKLVTDEQLEYATTAMPAPIEPVRDDWQNATPAPSV